MRRSFTGDAEEERKGARWTRENRKVLHLELMSGLVMPRLRQVTALAA